MKLMLTTLSDELFNIEVADDIELLNFKALCEFECGIPATQIAILWNGRPLHDDKLKLKDYGIIDGEMLLVQRIQGARGTPSTVGSAPSRNPGMLNIDFGSIHIPGSSGQQAAPPVPLPQIPQSQDELPEDPAALREMLLASPHDLSILKERNPPLAEALLSGSLEKFAEVLHKQQNERLEHNRERIRMMNANPFDPDIQKKIAEEIRLKNVETNMETAMEFAPESFGQVVMLYIDCQVNGQPVKAFVDSGAQMTIMSQACAERCHINRLIDTRWAGVAKGVGTQKILGRVHLCQIQIGPDFLQSSFSILEDQPMDMLLGLDMLKRHQCCIDLKRNILVIGTTGRETPFLGEGDVPEHARLNRTIESGQTSEDQQLAEALQRSAQEAAAQPSASGPSASTSSPSAPSQAFPEKDIQQLMSQGFSRSQVIQELELVGGNVDAALVALLTKSFQMP